MAVYCKPGKVLQDSSSITIIKDPINLWATIHQQPITLKQFMANTMGLIAAPYKGYSLPPLGYLADENAK